MQFNIDSKSPHPIYAQLVDQIKSKIIGEILLPGSPLPSVRDMAQLLAINSLTVSKAYKILEAEEYIEIKKGVGAFVSTKDSHLPQEKENKALKKRGFDFIEKAKEHNINLNQSIELIKNWWREV